jgi:hypothetical protein
MAKGQKRRRHLQDNEICPFCRLEFNTMGLSSHVRACKQKHDDRLQDAEYSERLQDNTSQGDFAEEIVAGKSSTWA